MLSSEQLRTDLCNLDTINSSPSVRRGGGTRRGKGYPGYPDNKRPLPGWRVRTFRAHGATDENSWLKTIYIFTWPQQCDPLAGQYKSREWNPGTGDQETCSWQRYPILISIYIQCTSINIQSVPTGCPTILFPLCFCHFLGFWSPYRGTSDLYSTALEICYIIATWILKIDLEIA